MEFTSIVGHHADYKPLRFGRECNQDHALPVRLFRLHISWFIAFLPIQTLPLYVCGLKNQDSSSII